MVTQNMLRTYERKKVLRAHLFQSYHDLKGYNWERTRAGPFEPCGDGLVDVPQDTIQLHGGGVV